MNTENVLESIVDTCREAFRVLLLLDIDYSLTPREIKAFSMCFGLADGRAHTVEEAGAKYGVSCARMHRLVAKLFHGCHTPEERRKLREFLDD